MCVNTFNLLFTDKVIEAGIHKMLIRIANTEDPVQEQSDLGLHCLSRCYFYSLHPSQQFFSHVGTGLSGMNQY